ncbi:O-antigen ligase family protein [Chryseobacterium flavum]|uniref:O-antigen ligase family protein n=1 Tax=Chryseobacterium flavum TaxID=415851 RepID=UPI0028AF362A|nr:O-antigen ligase family protein [Chryseobacterium flavum]
MLSKEKVRDFVIKYYSFFLFSGFYIGLELILFTGNKSLSRFYTLPVRLVFPFLAIILIKTNKKFFVNKNTVLIFVLFLYYVLKVLFSENLPQASLSRSWFEYILYFIIYCFTTFIFFSNVNLKKYLPTIIRTILLSGFLLSICTIYLYKDALFSGVGRISMLKYQSGMEDSDIISPLSLAYGAALNLSLLLPYYKLYAKKTVFTKVYLLLNAVFSLIIFALGSTRGAFLALVLSVLFYIVSSRGSKFKYVIITVLFVPVFFYILNLTGSNLLDRTTNAVEGGDSSGRNILWEAAIKEFINYPIFGGRIEVSGIYPHNIFLEVAMAMGIVGLFLFIFIIVNSLVRFYNLKFDYKIFVYIFFLNALCQHLFTGAFWGSILLFFSLGLMNFNTNDKSL